MPRLWCLDAGRALAGALLLLASACEANEPPQDEPGKRPDIGLMGTIPVYWGESDSLGDLVDGRANEHWARERIEARFAIVPLDALTPESLASLRRLIMAQPRALSPAENVALDAWVREGGHLLLFADPMLTGESRFPIGDRRRSSTTGGCGWNSTSKARVAPFSSMPRTSPFRSIARACSPPAKVPAAMSPGTAFSRTAGSARERSPCWPTLPCSTSTIRHSVPSAHSMA